MADCGGVVYPLELVPFRYGLLLEPVDRAGIGFWSDLEWLDRTEVDGVFRGTVFELAVELPVG